MGRLLRVLVVAALAGLVLWLLLPAPGPRVEPGSVLVIDVEGDYVEAAAPSLLGRVFGDVRRSFVSLLSDLEKARRDDRLEGVLLRIRRTGLSWAQVQELREAVGALGESGRRTLAYLETGGLGANREYYLASAADEVFLAPTTQSPVIGLAMQFLFLGGLWEKLGAGFEALGSGPYKSAAETIAGTEMSAAHREMATWLLDSTYEQFVAGIAEGRGLDPERVRELVDEAPVRGEALESAGLVDGVADFDVALSRFGDRPTVEGADYAAVPPGDVGFEPVATFALVYGSGTVVVGEGNSSPTGEPLFTSDGVGKALRDAAEDPEIDAILFRVDSPGGSPTAADIVWRAAEIARREGKPLVASVSGMAASAGYYALAGADAVLAPPASLVGSIGVFVLRPELERLLARLDVGVATLTRGSHADLLLFSRPLDDEGRERLRDEIDALYELFVSRVADGRDMTPAQVDAVGQGRVFTGAQALEKGLVDELGGLRAAARRAKVLAGLDADADVSLVPYPPPKSLAEQLAEAWTQASARAVPRLPLPDALEQAVSLLVSLPAGHPLWVSPVLVDIR